MHFVKETDSTQQKVAMAVNSNYLDKIHSTTQVTNIARK